MLKKSRQKTILLKRVKIYNGVSFIYGDIIYENDTHYLIIPDESNSYLKHPKDMCEILEN
jgi:hypothetical protein